MLLAMILSVVLVLMTCMFHFLVLRWLSGGMSRIAMVAEIRIVVIVLGMLAAHLVEIGLYAVAYALGVHVFDLGNLGGLTVDGPLDYFYFSIVSYTSLGLGDVFPGGHLRFITGIEALNGLLLIAWSGSFIYIAMGHLWPWQSCEDPSLCQAEDTK